MINYLLIEVVLYHSRIIKYLEHRISFIEVRKFYLLKIDLFLINILISINKKYF
jgi:hypothetical protein